MSLGNYKPDWAQVELAPQPPHIYGPVWARLPDGGWYLPKYTLGWGVLAWWYKYVRSPGGKTAGGPFIPTLEQCRFTLWWYAVDEEGKYVYREGMLRRLKGWGKDPFAAALALAEMCGPVAFSHFEGEEVVGKPRHAAWVTVAAVSQDQTKNTFALFPLMISSELKRDYGLDVNKFIIYAEGGARRIEAATSSPASMEGNRPTFCIENETQWWGCGPGGDVNDGHSMNDVIEGNLAKTPGARKLAICNAHIPGNDTVAEKVHDLWMDILAGKAIDTGLLYDALEAPADTPISEIPNPKDDPEGYEAGVQRLREGVIVACGDSYWLPVDEIVQTILTATNDVIESRRKFLNQVNASEDSWIAPTEWDLCWVKEPGKELRPDDRITLGFDGSKSNDWTALVACRVDDAELFVIKVWDPEKYPGQVVPRDEVDAVVRSCFARFDVVAFRADVREFEAYVDQWGKDFRRKLKVNASPNNPVAFDMRGQTKRFALDCERFRDAVLEQEIRHDGNAVLKQHITNARFHPTIYDAVSIRKPSKNSDRKIDAAVCAVLAFGARQDFLMSKDYNTGSVVIFR